MWLPADGDGTTNVADPADSAVWKKVHESVFANAPIAAADGVVTLDTPKRAELIAAAHTLEEIRRYIGADSLGYLSLDGLLSAVGSARNSYCTSCYTGRYPVAFPANEAAYLQLALKLVE